MDAQLNSPLLVVPAAKPVLVPVVGQNAFFPVRRVYCVGRNYAAHAVEMGFSGREPPFFFMKPTDAVVPVPSGVVGRTHYPTETEDYQFEAELVVAISKPGTSIALENAIEHVYGYALGLDMTRRDLQIEMRKQGRPWEIGKSFDGSAPMGPIHRVADIGEVRQGAISLSVDGEVRQLSDFGLLIWSVPEVIAYLSRYFELMPGDLIFTGTPDGVGAVRRGQTMTVQNPLLGELKVSIPSD